MKYNFGEPFKPVEKYVGNPFVNTKEDYYNEIVQKIICSILYSKNIKKIDYLVFDLLFDFFLKRINSIGTNCKKLSSLRSSQAVNYIDVKFCLKINFAPLYKEIYTSKKINILNNFTLDVDQESTCQKDLINVVNNSYLYHKQLCMRKSEKNDLLNEFNSMNCFYLKNNLPYDFFKANKDINILFLNRNIDVQKYKELMKLKKKYIHDHMPIIPLTINMKEKKIGYIDSTEVQDESISNSSSNDDENEEESDSSSSSNDVSSSSSSNDSNSSASANSKKSKKKSGAGNKERPYANDETSKEKIELLTLLPKLKEIYAQNSKKKGNAGRLEYFPYNSRHSFEMV